jgi:hypothetical protein
MTTRRQILKWTAAAAAMTVLPRRLPLWAAPESPSDPITIPTEPATPDEWTWVSRVIHSVAVYAEPATNSGRRATYQRDQSFPILGEVRAPFSAHNDLWYQTEEGYVHSAWVLPLRQYPPQPFIEVTNEFGFWAEVARPYTEGYVTPSTSGGRKYRFYGSCVFRVLDSLLDGNGTGWYKVKDDYPPRQNTNHQWVLAEDMRRIPRNEMAPIHPFVGNKRMEIVNDTQTLICYEGDEVVFTTKFAGGLGGALSTPPGQYHVLLKQASRHMANTSYAGQPPAEQATTDIFDLPGVPWNIFFTLRGHAIHGAYWHNDFGVRRSHGCVNVPIDAGRWLYRWVHPIGAYDDDFIRSDSRVGTPIDII